MTTTLVVVRPFGTHAKGDAITDASTVAQILAGEQARNVVRVLSAASTVSTATPGHPPATQGG